MSSVRRGFESASPAAFTGSTAFVAFSVYFCMYGLRRPYAVATWEGEDVLGVDAKTALLVSQVLGYAVSKWIGVKVVAEMPAHRRALAIVAAAGLAEVALIGLAASPPAVRPLWMFLNGLPLGIIWGLVFGFLEGRRVSDWLGAGLCASFILASGVVKSVGRQLLASGVPEAAMPAVTGALFLAPMLAFVALLAQVPPPTTEDEAARAPRAPMDGPARRAFVLATFGGLAPLLLGYVGLTAYRDFRDSFARELWDALGWAEAPGILAASEIPVAFGALLPVILVASVADNRAALRILHGVLVGGFGLIGVATGAFLAGWLDPALWMIATGLGAYLAYVPYNCVLFDRLVAARGSLATAAFLIQLADSLGYVGTVGLLLGRSAFSPELPWVTFFAGAGLVVCAAGVALTIAAGRWFDRSLVTA